MLAYILIIVLLPTLAFAGELSGKPRVIDGDSLAFGKERVRMEGIDAPENRQECKTDSGVNYSCGKVSTAALRNMIGDAHVTCKTMGKDRYKRHLAICFANNINLNQWMVMNGHAMAYRKYDKRFVTEEEHAKEHKHGIWKGSFLEPWEWRRMKRKKK